jgi:hypothetical protein
VKRLVTEGSFAVTREQLGGYFLVDAKYLDEALVSRRVFRWRAKGTVEARPVIEIPGSPSE